MTRTVNVTLSGLACGGELQAIITISTIRPHCIEYALARVTVCVDGCEVTSQAQGITDTSALTTVAKWLIKTFGAKVATLDRQAGSVLRAPA